MDCEGQQIDDWCHVLVNGTGFLNDWKWPKIPGVHDFKGTLVHSANWDTSIDYSDKTVAVIGTGSSSIQIVPQVQKKAKHLTAFMRSVTWISPVVGEADLQAEKEKQKPHTEADKQDSSELIKQYWYTEEDKQRFRDDPAYLLLYRRKLESAVNNLFDMFISGSDVSKGAEQMMRAEMNRRIGPGHEELKEKLIPAWPPGCRRITPGDGYLEALVQPNVTTCHEEIEKIVPEGVVDATGKLHKVDILACATGFNIAFSPPFEMIGTNGARMADEFEPEPQVYLAMTVPKFPNCALSTSPILSRAPAESAFRFHHQRRPRQLGQRHLPPRPRSLRRVHPQVRQEDPGRRHPRAGSQAGTDRSAVRAY